MIPFYVLLSVYYGIGVRDGLPSEALRWAAVAVFAVAAASDGLDGWVARRFNQRTELGVFLDPIADKGLLLSGILTLSFSPWKNALPVWFGVLVVARDILVLAGVVMVFILHGSVSLRTRWTGKTATALQMLLLTCVMLQPDWVGLHLLPEAFSDDGGFIRVFDLLVLLTAVFTLVSGFGYVGEGIAQVHSSGHGDPAKWAGNRGAPFDQEPEDRRKRRGGDQE